MQEQAIFKWIGYVYSKKIHIRKRILKYFFLFHDQMRDGILGIFPKNNSKPQQHHSEQPKETFGLPITQNPTRVKNGPFGKTTKLG